jgi:Ca2+-binding RTX toxin-like protein
VDGGAGNDGIFVAFADTQSTVLHGGAGDDSVTGGQGESQLYGDDGHDTISGYNGRSDAYGGSGDDTIYNTSSYSMAGTGTGTIDGGSGYDIATIERSAGGATYNIDFTAASITLADGTQILRCEAISFVASSANDTMTASNGSGGYLHNKLNGLGGDDVLIASSNGATLDGSTGTNRLIASRSVDSLAWGIAEYSASDKGVTVDLNITTAQGGKGYAKGDLIQATVLSVTGSDFADKLTGDTFTNTLNGGAGNDRLTGGTGFHDMLTGGAGKDNFVYGGAADSTGANYDSVGDFDAKQDTFQVVSAVSKIDNTIGSGALNQASFDADLGAAIGSALKAGHAILFTPDSGTLAGKTFLVVDQDGTVGYQSGGDLVLDITGATHLSNLAAGNFVV